MSKRVPRATHAGHRLLAALALELSAQLPDAIGMRLVQAAAPGPEVVAVLQRDAQAELAAVLDLLEPAAGPQPQPQP
jgi:hypothetical protein